jgi:predicted nucleic acid-binding protein
MDRLFLDANVLFSAAYRESAGLTRLWDNEDAAIVSSTYAITEAQRNLDREDQRVRLAKLLASIEVVDAVQMPPGSSPVALPDKDIPILAGAIAAGATHLITGDRQHFGQFFGKRLEDILILPPGDYLAGR